MFRLVKVAVGANSNTYCSGSRRAELMVKARGVKRLQAADRSGRTLMKHVSHTPVLAVLCLAARSLSSDRTSILVGMNNDDLHCVFHVVRAA